MTANSYFARFREIYEEIARLNDDLYVLTQEANKDPADDVDVPTLKRVARLAARDKLMAEGEKLKRFARVAEECTQLKLI